MRTRVASRDWWASRNVVSVTADRDLLPQPSREPLGPQLAQELPGAVGGGLAVAERGQLVGGLDDLGPTAVRPVDRRLGEVGEEARAAVGGLAEAQQAGALVDEARGDAARLEVRVVEDGGQERQVRLDAADAELRDGAARPPHGLLEAVAVAGELDQHRVEVRADLGPGVGRAAVEPHAGAARRAVVADHAGVRAEAVGRVLGGDPALQRGAGERHLVLAEVQLGEGGARGDAQLRDDEVAVGDLLGDRVLDLDARVHLDEDVVAALVEEELDGARVDVPDGSGERDGVGADPVPQLGVEVGRGRDLDHLLVAALHRAVALVEVDDVALGVGEDLHLDVARVDHRLLEEHGGVAERGLGLAHGRVDGVAQVLGPLDPAHAAPATARDGLDEDRETDVVGRGDQRVDVGGGRAGAQHRHARLPGRGDRPRLVAGEVQHVGGRPDERDARLGARLREIGVLREEAVAGVDGVGARPAGRLHHLVDGEVRADRVADLADLVRLVGLGAVQGVAVLVREDRHRGDAELVRGAERPDGDLTPVGDQHLAEHGGLLVAAGLLLRDCAAGFGDLGGTLPGGTRSDPCERHPGGVPRRRAPPSSPGGDAAVPACLRRSVRRWAAPAGGGPPQAPGGRAAL